MKRQKSKDVLHFMRQLIINDLLAAGIDPEILRELVKKYRWNEDNWNDALPKALEKLMAIEEAAKELRIKPGTVQRLIRLRMIPAIPFGRTFRILPSDLQRFLETHRTFDPLKVEGNGKITRRGLTKRVLEFKYEEEKERMAQNDQHKTQSCPAAA